jgi:2-oxoglutarate dehydrogenase E2 component (dihydrolipoamide succinyltransferase)
MGEGVSELTVVNWLKNEGETVKELEGVVELETDKVTTEIPSPVAGTILKILAQRDEVVKVGATLAWIGQPGEALESDAPLAGAAALPEAPKPAAAEPAPAPGPAPAPAKLEYTGPVSPLVKKLVAENQVDLNLVRGTGQHGRITKEDVQNYLASRKAAPAPAVERPPEAAAAPIPTPAGMPAALAGELIPHTSIRRQIAERLVQSQHTAPHVLTVMESDLSRVMAHRAAQKAALAAQGINLTLTAYFCSAIVSGLKACPNVNSSWLEAGIQRYRSINLGMATSLGEEGLIVPVIKDADLLSLSGLAQKINDLSARARAKKLLPDEVKGGTFTLTNHGTGGSLFASPIIFQPQAAILGVGRMQKRVVVVTDASGNDAIAIRPMVYLSLVFDHRILDGDSADRFLKVVKDTLENWG